MVWLMLIALFIVLPDIETWWRNKFNVPLCYANYTMPDPWPFEWLDLILGEEE